MSDIERVSLSEWRNPDANRRRAHTVAYDKDGEEVSEEKLSRHGIEALQDEVEPAVNWRGV